MQIKIGQTIPLTLQLGDGATNKFIKATIVKPDGSTLQTANLAHASLGMYFNSAVLMPAIYEFLAVVYEVYSDSGHTTLDLSYDKNNEVFALDSEIQPEDGEIMKLRVDLSKREIVQGDKTVISIYLYDDYDHGRPLDITSFNKYSVSIPYSGGVLEVSEVANINDSIISLVSAPRGELTLTIFPDDTDLLNEGVFDMQVKIDNASPNPQSVILPDGITVREKVEA